MTLLLGAVTRSRIVLAADGLCVKKFKDGTRKEITRVQKIFPLGRFPVALVHHGQNVIDACPIEAVVKEFLSATQGNMERWTLQTMATEFADKFGPRVLATLERLRADGLVPGVVGFWFAGFGSGEGPGLYEVCWPDKPTPVKLSNDDGSPSTAWGGNGSKYVCREMEQYASRLGHNVSPSAIRKFFRALYKDALRLQEEEVQKSGCQRVFGGEYQELVVSADGCAWKSTNTFEQNVGPDYGIQPSANFSYGTPRVGA